MTLRILHSHHSRKAATAQCFSQHAGTSIPGPHWSLLFSCSLFLVFRSVYTEVYTSPLLSMHRNWQKSFSYSVCTEVYTSPLLSLHRTWQKPFSYSACTEMYRSPLLTLHRSVQKSFTQFAPKSTIAPYSFSIAIHRCPSTRLFCTQDHRCPFLCLHRSLLVSFASLHFL